MAKVAVVFYSGTGNTEAMANAVADGVKSKGGEAELIQCVDFNASMIPNYDSFAFGCPAMGSEVLEEGDFDPMFTSVESSLAGKKVGLFGSYGWGDGEWMRNWVDRCKADGIDLVGEGVIANEAPDDDAVKECNALGEALA